MRTSGGVAGPTSTSAARHGDMIIETLKRKILKGLILFIIRLKTSCQGSWGVYRSVGDIFFR